MRRFYEGTIWALGWVFNVFLDFDLRSSRWGLYYSWFRLHRDSSRWSDSYTAVAMGLGPIHVYISASRAWKKTRCADDVRPRASPLKSESPLTGVRTALYFEDATSRTTGRAVMEHSAVAACRGAPRGEPDLRHG